jgi:hypothetical protein
MDDMKEYRIVSRLVSTTTSYFSSDRPLNKVEIHEWISNGLNPNNLEWDAQIVKGDPHEIIEVSEITTTPIEV